MIIYYVFLSVKGKIKSWYLKSFQWLLLPDIIDDENDMPTSNILRKIYLLIFNQLVKKHWISYIEIWTINLFRVFIFHFIFQFKKNNLFTTSKEIPFLGIFKSNVFSFPPTNKSHLKKLQLNKRAGSSSGRSAITPEGVSRLIKLLFSQ